VSLPASEGFLKPKQLILGIAFALAALGVIAAVVWSFLLAPAEDAAVKYVPQDAALYLNVFTNPSNGQKSKLRDIFESFPIEGKPEDVLEALEPVIDGVIGDFGLTFGRDVQPWLGGQVALFATGFEPDANGAVLIATTDGEAALDAVSRIRERDGDEVETKTHRNVEYQVDGDDTASGLVEDFLVVGTEGGFRATVDALESGDSLETSDMFTNTTRNLARDRLALFYVDLLQLLRTPQGGLVGAAAAQVFPAFLPAASAVYARSDALVVESVAAVPDEGRIAERMRASARRRGLLNEMPGSAWAVLGLPDFADTFRALFFAATVRGIPGVSAEQIEQQFLTQTGIDLQRDLLSWIGNAGVFLSGSGPGEVQGAVVIESKNPRRTVEALARIGGLLLQLDENVSFLPPGTFSEGFVVRSPADGSREPIYVVFDEVNSRAIVTYGLKARLEAVSPDLVSDNGGFKRAMSDLGHDYTPRAYVHVPTLVKLLTNLNVISGPAYEDAKPFLAPISHITIGSRLVRDNVLQRIVIGIDPSSGS
jgi:Protein of unknown function (DUF3352)